VSNTSLTCVRQIVSATKHLVESNQILRLSLGMTAFTFFVWVIANESLLKLGYNLGMDVESVIDSIQDGNRVFVHGGAATPRTLLRSLMERAGVLKNIELVSISTQGDGIFDCKDFAKSFFINSLFVSSNVRHLVNQDLGDYVPIFLSEIPRLFARKDFVIDVAMIHTSMPDKNGYVSLGTSVDIAASAVRHAKKVIAQFNPHMPRTHGDGMVHISRIDAYTEVDEPLVELAPCHLDEAELRIGQHVASLVEDGATLQAGIGSIPDAVMRSLSTHKDLGIHTELLSDGMLELIKSGAVSNRLKKKRPGVNVTGFALGSKELYQFVDDHPKFSFLDIGYVNDERIIRENPKVVAVNSALEVDLSGQICADTLGPVQYSGVGGQMDFMRGASLSEGGKAIIALKATTKKGDSKIVTHLRPYSSVTTTRAHVHYVVTEYGIAYLFGKNLRQRAQVLIAIAHPDHREGLSREFYDTLTKKKVAYV
jgi:acyl-CoA hydrolase